MLIAAVTSVLLRELRSVRRELEAYPDDATVWRLVPGVQNSAGTLALHLAGNLQHFTGTVLGGSSYRRDRDAEFATRGLPRARLLQEIDRAERAVKETLDRLDDRRLGEAFPVPLAGYTVTVGDALIHLAVHAGYHLGQLDYHRRAVTGEALAVTAVSPSELASAKPA